MVRRWIVPVTLILAMACGGEAPGAGGAEETEDGTPAAEGAAQGAAGEAASADARNWIEYGVTGEVEGEGRDTDVMMCSTTGEDFLARSLGEWVFDFEIPGTGAAGEHQGRMSLAVPRDQLPEGGDMRRDWRLRGDVTVEIEDAGQDAMGMRVVDVDFTGADLASEQDVTASVSGSFRCSVMPQG